LTSTADTAQATLTTVHTSLRRGPRVGTSSLR
jgi:hypothetical protein